MTTSPPVDEAPAAQELRGRLFTELDHLAFALEMEAARHLELGNEAAAESCQQQRLGVRLAQRLVAGIWADEVQKRAQKWRKEYESRLMEAAP